VYNETGAARALIVCDHASPAIPQGMRQLGLADWVFERHVAFDIGAASLARHLADRLGAPAILSGYSRLIVDPNRRTDDATAFAKVSDGIAVPGNLRLSLKERRRRIASFFEPYHAAITRAPEPTARFRTPGPFRLASQLTPQGSKRV
jgi:predicted N-formylglutamate amidohydrolase